MHLEIKWIRWIHAISSTRKTCIHLAAKFYESVVDSRHAKVFHFDDTGIVHDGEKGSVSEEGHEF